MLLGFLLGYRERRQERGIHRILAYACLAATALVLIWAIFSTMLVHLLS